MTQDERDYLEHLHARVDELEQAVVVLLALNEAEKTGQKVRFVFDNPPTLQ